MTLIEQPVTAVFRPFDGDRRPVSVTSAQLHAHSCIDCGSTRGGLFPVGHVYTAVEDGEIGWPVVACPDHRAGAAA